MRHLFHIFARQRSQRRWAALAVRVALVACALAKPSFAQRVQFPSAIAEIGDESLAAPFDDGVPYNTSDGPTVYHAYQPFSPAPWDPYSTSGVPDPPPTYVPTGEPQPGQSAFTTTYQQVTRFLNRLDVRYAYVPRTDGPAGFGFNDVDLSASFAVPFFFNSPLLITPGFNFHFWDGPQQPDLPPRVYDAYLAGSWNPQVGDRFRTDLGVSVGVYTDFETVTDQSIRILGRGVGYYRFAPQWEVGLGAAYIDRLQIKLLPVVGLVWTPSEDARFELMFPRPKLAHRIATYGSADVWGYVAGEYGGGAWTYDAPGTSDEVEYDDMRLIVGAEWVTFNGWAGLFEVAYVFNREIVIRSDMANKVEPGDSVMIRMGARF